MFKKITILTLITLIFGVFGSFSLVQAAVSVIPATGGENVAEGSGFVNLTNILISEAGNAEIGVGTHTFSLPAGWEFDTASTIQVTTTSSVMVINPVSLTPGVTSFSFNIEAPAVPGSDLAIKSMRVRPTGTAGGNITHSGAVIVGVDGSTNFGSLTVVGGSVTPPTAVRSSGGNGGGAGAPIKAPFNISVSINNGAEKTNNQEVTIHSTGTYISDMMIANDVADFNFSILEPYADFKQWTLSDGAGEKKVYLKFRSPTGVYTDPIEASIIYEPSFVEEIIEDTTDDIEEGMGGVRADVNQDGAVNIGDAIKVIGDLGGINKITDINESGLVDISDFNEVIVNWTGINGVTTKVDNQKDSLLSIDYPYALNMTMGQEIELPIIVTPMSNTIYTVRLVLDYPSNLFEVKDISLVNGWIPLAIGTDNDRLEDGTIIKTAGYPGGINETTRFGTITLKARGIGTGNIAINSGSVLMNVNGHNKYTGVSVALPTTVNVATATNINLEDTKKTDEEEVTTNEKTSLLASIGGLFTGTSGGVMLVIFLLVIVVVTVIVRRWNDGDKMPEVPMGVIKDEDEEDDK